MNNIKINYIRVTSFAQKRASILFYSIIYGRASGHRFGGAKVRIKGHL